MSRSSRTVRLALPLLILAVAGCAMAPPGTQVPLIDAKQVVGTWTGDVMTRSGSIPFRLVVRENGTFDGLAPSLNLVSPGTFKVVGGKVEVVNARGVKGAWILYDRGGQQVLLVTNDEGARGEMTRAQ
jgi:hypothetical protein